MNDYGGRCGHSPWNQSISLCRLSRIKSNKSSFSFFNPAPIVTHLVDHQCFHGVSNIPLEKNIWLKQDVKMARRCPQWMNKRHKFQTKYRFDRCWGDITHRPGYLKDQMESLDQHLMAKKVNPTLTYTRNTFQQDCEAVLFTIKKAKSEICPRKRSEPKIHVIIRYPNVKSQ